MKIDSSKYAIWCKGIGWSYGWFKHSEQERTTAYWAPSVIQGCAKETYCVKGFEIFSTLRSCLPISKQTALFCISDFPSPGGESCLGFWSWLVVGVVDAFEPSDGSNQLAGSERTRVLAPEPQKYSSQTHLLQLQHGVIAYVISAEKVERIFLSLCCNIL
jgi:hypothetical protein